MIYATTRLMNMNLAILLRLHFIAIFQICMKAREWTADDVG